MKLNLKQEDFKLITIGFLPALFSGYGYKTLYLPVNHRPRNYGISKYGTMNRLFKGIRDTIYVYKILTKKLNK